MGNEDTERLIQLDVPIKRTTLNLKQIFKHKRCGVVILRLTTCAYHPRNRTFEPGDRLGRSDSKASLVGTGPFDTPAMM